MKKIIIVLILFFSVLASQAQKKYSQENLERLSQEELDSCLNNAVKLQISGKTTTIVGGATLGVTAISVILIGKSMELGVVVVGFIGGIAGLGAMATGISMKITGKKRVERINTIKNTAYDGIKIDLKPCAQYNLATQNYQPAVTLRIRF